MKIEKSLLKIADSCKLCYERVKDCSKNFGSKRKMRGL